MAGRGGAEEEESAGRALRRERVLGEVLEARRREKGGVWGDRDVMWRWSRGPRTNSFGGSGERGAGV